MATIVAKCLLCNTDIDSNDHYRDLDCSFPNCSGKGYHEDCVVKYLRKKGNGPEQKTGFSCPATLDNGKSCNGTIRKTHIKTPTNEKKKEMSRQAAIAVNQLANAARSTQPAKAAVQVVSQKAAPLRLKAQPGAIKGLNVAVIHRPGQRPVGIRSDDHDDSQPTAPPRSTIADFFATVKTPAVNRANSVKSNEDTGVGRKAVAWANRNDTPDAGPTDISRVVAKNIASAPEPVTRQRVIPGWSGPVKPTTKASLAEDRARAAAVRAEIKGIAGRKTAAENGPTSTATKPAAKPPQPTPEYAVPGFEAATWQPQDASATADQLFFGAGTTEPSSPTAAAATAAAATAPDTPPFHLSPDEFPTFPTTGSRAAQPSSSSMARSASMGANLSTKPSVPAPTTPPAEAEPLASGQDSPLAYSAAAAAAASGSAISLAVPEPAEAVAEAEEADPIVRYDPLFAGEDGSYLVQDEEGNYMRVEDVYGPDVEFASAQVEAGMETWYVAVRLSHVTAATAAAAVAAAAPDATGESQKKQTAAVADVTMFGMAATGWGATVYTDAAATKLAPQVHVLQPDAGYAAAAAAGDGDDDLEDLLALCLGE